MKRVYHTDTDMTRLSGAPTRVKLGDVVVINTKHGQHIFKAVPHSDSPYRCHGCYFNTHRGCPRLTTSISRFKYPSGKTKEIVNLCDVFLCTGSYNNTLNTRIIFKSLETMLEDL